MEENVYLSWISSLEFLRTCDAVPAALGNATTLVAARRRWGQHLVCRTSMHDLLFTAAGAEFPFVSHVRVKVEGPRHLVVYADRTRVSEVEGPASEVDRNLDDALEALAAPRQVCRACGEQSDSPDFLTVFERMHYVCFHFEFEHGATDRDRACEVPGCPVV